MKKIFLTTILFTAAAFSSNASVLFTSSCGEVTVTIGPECFDNVEEAIIFYLELDDILCNQEQDTDNESDETNPEGNH